MPAQPSIGAVNAPLDPNTAFATKTALAFKNAYTSQNPSVLLDMFIYFRNNDQSVTYKSTSSALLNMTSDIFGNISSNIAGLPKELNPEAIDKILKYIHGDALVFPKPLTDESMVHKSFIAACYFKQSKLANKLKTYAIENLNMNLDWDDMYNFVQSLPPPLFMTNFPTSIDQLPSMDNPAGGTSAPQQAQQPQMQQQQQQQQQQQMQGMPQQQQMVPGQQIMAPAGQMPMNPMQQQQMMYQSMQGQGQMVPGGLQMMPPQQQQQMAAGNAQTWRTQGQPQQVQQQPPIGYGQPPMGYGPQ